MKRINWTDNSIKEIWKGRAAIGITIAVSAFLCALTIFEFVALRMEWNIPALNYITGGADSYLFQEYRNEEMTLDNSAENVLLEDVALINLKEDTTQRQDSAEKEDNEFSEEVSTEEVSDTEEIDSTEDFSTTGKNDGTENVNGGKVENQDENTGKTENVAAGDDAELVEEEIEFPYYIKVNRKQNCITIYTQDENGEYTIPYKAIICSTGLYNATPTGTFHMSTKYLWRALYGGVYGQYATRITGGVLFHSVPYYRKSKSALCTDKYNKLGQQASMGCIRLTVEDAKWIADNCPSGTAVEIYDDENPGPLGKPIADKIDTDNPNKGWDPTDPDYENPWNKISEDE